MRGTARVDSTGGLAYFGLQACIPPAGAPNISRTMRLPADTAA
jgi:hypothetical protein